jgi:hypothetical protein
MAGCSINTVSKLLLDVGDACTEYRDQTRRTESKGSGQGHSHGMPVFSTNKMSVNTSRSATRLRPGYLNLRSTTGSNGSIRSHNPSLTKVSP